MGTSKKKRLFNNVILTFLGLTIFVMLLSLVGNALGWQATYSKINSVTGNIEKTVVGVTNLFSYDEMRLFLGNAIANFVSFAPLGAFLVSLIGIGVAYKSGLLTVIFTVIGRFFNKFWMTFLFVFIGIISNFMGDAGYIILIPLAAIFYLVNNRNPIVGIVATFVAVATGQGVNFVLSNLNYGLNTFTRLAANLKEVTTNVNGNIFFCVVSTISLSFLITYITEKIIIPRLPKYKRDEEMIEELVVGRKEKRGLVLSTVISSLLILGFIYMLIPGWPSSGLLLDSSGKTYVEMLFGANAYFSSSIVYIISIILFVSGIMYGLGAKTIRNREQLSKMAYSSFDNIGGVIIMLFMASQFITLFKHSNIGTVITIWLIDLLSLLNFSSLPLIFITFIFIGISNIFLTSSITKWTIASPIIVPLFMNSNMTPEFAQAVFRVSDSATNLLTPLFAYFIIFIGYLEIYNKSENRVSFRDSYKMLWPYSLAIALLWLFVILAWYIIGLPIGFGTYPTT